MKNYITVVGSLRVSRRATVKESGEVKVKLYRNQMMAEKPVMTTKSVNQLVHDTEKDPPPSPPTQNISHTYRLCANTCNIASDEGHFRAFTMCSRGERYWLVTSLCAVVTMVTHCIYICLYGF